MTRPTYAREALHALTFPFGVSLMEGAVIGMLAKKAFAVSDFQFATLMAAPLFTNVTSLLWAYAARGKAKVPVLTALQLCMLVTVALVAILPTDGAGPTLLVMLIVVSRCLMVGIITLRSTIWRMNYPRHVRAQVIGRLTTITSILTAAVPLAAAAYLDDSPNAFTIVYPVGAAVSLIGVWYFSGVRLRRERELLRYERRPGVRPQPHGTPAPIYEYDLKPPTPSFWSVLKQDRLFRRYMGWQFLNGMSNMSAEVLLIYIVAALTAKAASKHEYLLSISITHVIPWVLVPLTMPLWARYLDRVHVLRFRTWQNWFWVGSQIGYWIGAAYGSLMVLGIARVISGLGRGGGMLAWQLGHNDFADRRLVAQYMGINVTLTGIRGAVAPFLAIALYTGWAKVDVPLLGWTIPSFDGGGSNIFGLTLAAVLISQVGYIMLAKSLPSQTKQ